MPLSHEAGRCGHSSGLSYFRFGNYLDYGQHARSSRPVRLLDWFPRLESHSAMSLEISFDGGVG